MTNVLTTDHAANVTVLTSFWLYVSYCRHVGGTLCCVSVKLLASVCSQIVVCYIRPCSRNEWSTTALAKILLKFLHSTHSLFALSIPPKWRRGFMLSSMTLLNNWILHYMVYVHFIVSVLWQNKLSLKQHFVTFCQKIIYPWRKLSTTFNAAYTGCPKKVNHSQKSWQNRIKTVNKAIFFINF